MTEQLKIGYARNKEVMTFRTPENIQEMVSHCSDVSHIWFRANDGLARRAKVNGKVRTWKRDKDRVEIPLKYGLREYATFYAHDIDKVLIPVGELTWTSVDTSV